MLPLFSHTEKALTELCVLPIVSMVMWKLSKLLLHLCTTCQTLLVMQTALSKAENTLHIVILLVKFQIVQIFRSNEPTFPLTLTRRPLIPVTRR